MTLHEFLSIYGDTCHKDQIYDGNDYISIDRYCEEWKQEEVMTSEWYGEIKDKPIRKWQTIGGGIYETEICIFLDD